MEKTSSRWIEVRSYLFLLSMLLNFATRKTNSRCINNPHELRTLGYILSGLQCVCHGMGSHEVCGTGGTFKAELKPKDLRHRATKDGWWVSGGPWAEKENLTFFSYL